jgi:hypothetical protein
VTDPVRPAPFAFACFIAAALSVAAATPGAPAGRVALGTATIAYDPAVWTVAAPTGDAVTFACIAADCRGRPQVLAMLAASGRSPDRHLDASPIVDTGPPVPFRAISYWSGCPALDAPILLADGTIDGQGYLFTTTLNLRLQPAGRHARGAVPRPAARLPGELGRIFAGPRHVLLRRSKESPVPEVSNELIYETLKSIQADVSSLKLGQTELKAEMQAFRGHMISLQQDTHNIYAILARHDQPLDRIERRLQIAEPADL